MSILTLTEEEKKLPFNQWDDAALGRAMKHTVNILNDDTDCKASLRFTAAAVFLIHGAIMNGAEKIELQLDAGIDEKGTALGDWLITATQLVKPGETEDDAGESAD